MTGLIGIEREATALRAMRLALGIGPADAFEGVTGFLIRHTGHGRQRERPGRRGKEEMLLPFVIVRYHIWYHCQ